MDFVLVLDEGPGFGTSPVLVWDSPHFVPRLARPHPNLYGSPLRGTESRVAQTAAGYGKWHRNWPRATTKRARAYSGTRPGVYVSTMASPSLKKRDRTRENFVKSCKSGAAQFDKLNRKYGAHIYLQVQWKGKYYEYSSQEDPGWQKTAAELAITYPLPVQWTPATFASRYINKAENMLSDAGSKIQRR